MKTFTLKTRYETYENCFLRYGYYEFGHTLYIGIYTYDEPIATLTVNLPTGKSNEESNFVDVNNFPECFDIIYGLELGEMTGDFEQSGYCLYPLVKFNIEKIKEYGVEIK